MTVENNGIFDRTLTAPPSRRNISKDKLIKFAKIPTEKSVTTIRLLNGVNQVLHFFHKKNPRKKKGFHKIYVANNYFVGIKRETQQA